MFERASHIKLRFECKGLCTVEELWDLPLPTLDNLYKKLNKKIKEIEGDSLLKIKDDGKDDILELKISIIKHIVKVRLEEAQYREDALTKTRKKQKLMEIISLKQDAQLYDMSIEDLNKLVEDL